MEAWSPRHASIREVLLEAFVHHEQIETLVVAWKTKPDGPEKTWTISTRLTGPDGKWALQDAQQILNHLHASLSKYP